MLSNHPRFADIFSNFKEAQKLNEPNTEVKKCPPGWRPLTIAGHKTNCEVSLSGAAENHVPHCDCYELRCRYPYR